MNVDETRYCGYCFVWFDETVHEHQQRWCTYFNGCPICGSMRVEVEHVKKCYENKEKRKSNAAVKKDDETAVIPIVKDERPIPVQVMESPWWNKPVSQGIKIVDGRKAEQG